MAYLLGRCPTTLTPLFNSTRVKFSLKNIFFLWRLGVRLQTIAQTLVTLHNVWCMCMHAYIWLPTCIEMSIQELKCYSTYYYICIQAYYCSGTHTHISRQKAKFLYSWIGGFHYFDTILIYYFRTHEYQLWIDSLKNMIDA